MDQNLILLTKKIRGGPKKILKINKYKILNYYIYIYIYFFFFFSSSGPPLAPVTAT